MMDFPIDDLLDAEVCYDHLVQLLHPEGLHCPQCGGEDYHVHRRKRDPLVDFQCDHCGRVFNAYTDTILEGSQWRPQQVWLLMRGIVQGQPTAQLARELGKGYDTVHSWRLRMMELAHSAIGGEPLPDEEVEPDEKFQNAGEKGIPHDDLDDPPRRRGNKRRGRGTWDNDRPPIAGIAGRQSGQARLKVVRNATQKILEAFVLCFTVAGTSVFTDENNAYGRLSGRQRSHATVCHNDGEWARDDDRDGMCEVHNNTAEGMWTGLEAYLRVFRGVSKHHLHLYVGIYQYAYNFKSVTDQVLRALLGVVPSTNLQG